MAMRAPGRPSIHVPFILASVAVAVFGGFVLAIELPLLAALGIPNAGWVTQAQVHGHLQTVGFVGLFIVGVSYHLVPGFSGGHALPYPRLVTPSLWLIGGGVLARAAGQLGAPSPAFAAILVAGAWAEAAGAMCAAANIVPRMWGTSRRGDPTGPFFVAGAAWFVVQAALGGWWLTAMVLRGEAMLPPQQDGLLTLIQFFGFHLSFILGVGSRSFPVFFAARRLTLRSIAVPLGVMQTGLVASMARPLATTAGGDAFTFLDSAGLLLLGIGVLWMSVLFGWWRPAKRVTPLSRGFAITLQIALGWLTIAGLLAALDGARALAGGSAPAWAILDAIRHVLAIGVVLTAMVAMAQLILPEFASERFSGRQAAWRGGALGGVLAVATLLRAGARLLGDQISPAAVQWSMAVGGMLALSVVIVFAALFLRGVRRHRELLERFAKLAASGQAWTLSEGAPTHGTPPDPR